MQSATDPERDQREDPTSAHGRGWFELFKTSSDYGEAESIRAFVKAASGSPMCGAVGFDGWASATLELADRLDPLIGGPPQHLCDLSRPKQLAAMMSSWRSAQRVQSLVVVAKAAGSIDDHLIHRWVEYSREINPLRVSDALEVDWVQRDSAWAPPEWVCQLHQAEARLFSATQIRRFVVAARESGLRDVAGLSSWVGESLGIADQLDPTIADLPEPDRHCRRVSHLRTLADNWDALQHHRVFLAAAKAAGRPSGDRVAVWEELVRDLDPLLEPGAGPQVGVCGQQHPQVPRAVCIDAEDHDGAHGCWRPGIRTSTHFGHLFLDQEHTVLRWS